jgi:iron-sulfur cluster assembly protein
MTRRAANTNMQKMMPIVKFTPLAKQKLSEALKEQTEGGSYLRIDVYASGGCACSGGYSYGMQLSERPRGNDIVEEIDDFKIVTDKNNAEILRGSKIDYVDTMQRQGFKIENPNISAAGCGCGGGGHGQEH